MTRLYGDLAGWWQAISPPLEYAEEGSLYVEMIRSAARRPLREVLELGSGGGNNASHMKRDFAMTLVEPSDEMRRLSVALNPECAHVPGDMRTVRLGQEFDAVFVHDAVMYMTGEADLRAALDEESPRFRAAVKDADFDTAMIWAGEGVDLITEVVPAGELVRRIGAETEAHLRYANELVIRTGPTGSNTGSNLDERTREQASVCTERRE